MSKFCPITREKVLYLDCLECNTKMCKRQIKENTKDKEIKGNVKLRKR